MDPLGRPASPLGLALAAILCAAAPCLPEERIEEKLDPRGTIELVYRDSVLVEERLIDPDGALLEVTFYAGKEAVSRERYIRDRGRLVMVETTDPSGAVIKALSYRYDSSGRLLAIESSDGSANAVAGMRAPGGLPRGSWSSSGTLSLAIRYDDRGRPVAQVTYLEGKVTQRETTSYGEGPFASSILLENLVDGSSVLTTYDTGGKPLLKVLSRGGSERERTEFRYDAAGRLLEESTRSAGELRTRSFSYNDEGALVREESRRGGVIERAIEYAEDLRIEESYDKGKLFVRAYYRSGRKIKDEFYDGGILLRSREYP